MPGTAINAARAATDVTIVCRMLILFPSFFLLTRFAWSSELAEGGGQIFRLQEALGDEEKRDARHEQDDRYDGGVGADEVVAEVVEQDRGNSLERRRADDEGEIEL